MTKKNWQFIREYPIDDIVGTHGYRTILWESEKRILKNGTKRRQVICKCICWKIRVMEPYDILKWLSKSCWCFKWEAISQNKKRHWMSETRFYKIWRSMKARCEDKKDKNYWGRWIWYDTKWKRFENFRDDMFDSYQNHIIEFWEKETSIDRINVNGNYCKENCRRLTNREQCNNLRKTKRYTYKWERHTRATRLRLIWIPPR